VEVCEDLGAECHLIFPVDAPRVSAEAVRAAAETTDDDTGKLFADDERAAFTAVLEARHVAAPGTVVELAIEPARIHCFDPGTGLALQTQPPAPMPA
jgi:multiple sugar transport system ATP-binding protein